MSKLVYNLENSQQIRRKRHKDIPFHEILQWIEEHSQLALWLWYTEKKMVIHVCTYTNILIHITMTS